jgi:hypothetical protein
MDVSSANDLSDGFYLVRELVSGCAAGGGIALPLTFSGPLSQFPMASVFFIKSMQFSSMFCRLLPYGPFPLRSIISIIADIFNVYTLILFGLSTPAVDEAVNALDFNATLNASTPFVNASPYNVTSEIDFNTTLDATNSLDNASSLSVWRSACLCIGIIAAVHGICMIVFTCFHIGKKCICCARAYVVPFAPNLNHDDLA